jgi:23S rRNA (adenine2030-N6)-methyltransferase
MDLNAGRGIYDLTNSESAKTQECRWGVMQKQWPNPLYQQLVEALNPKGTTLRFYPGSPDIARALMRPSDRLILVEKHPQEWEALQQYARIHKTAQNPRLSLHCRDTYESLLALIPPTEKRGIVVLDPSYENKAEFEWMQDALQKALQKWPTGVYFVWYPLLEGSPHQPLLRACQSWISPEKFFKNECLRPHQAPEGGLKGSGVMILNKPHTMC